MWGRRGARGAGGVPDGARHSAGAPPRRHRSQSSGGFTLLEVLGAVAIIGLSFTLLARANIEGLRAEGLARRTLEASLLADRTLAGLETDLQRGVVPELGTREDEVEGYRVRVEVTPLQVEVPALAGAMPAGFEDAGDGPTLLVPPRSGGPVLLRRVRIEVAWDEGAFERSVRRETFVFDVAGAQPLLAAVPPRPGEEEEAAARGAGSGAGAGAGAGDALQRAQDALGGIGGVPR